MPNALIIGASRGIGHEFVRQLLASGWKVFATARDEQGMQALREQGAQALKLDVTQPESLAGLGWQLDGEKFELAVYVAGVYGPAHQRGQAPTVQDFDHLMHTNVLGAMQAIPLVAPMVEAANGCLAFISSGMGSIGETQSSDGWLYRASKAALNMVVKTVSFDYPQAVCIALSPGWVRTEMGGPNAAISVEESVSGMLRVLTGLDSKDSGSFRDHEGRQLGW